MRSYRSNPAFLEEHLLELKGLKYSSKIDPYKELCRFELSGGICNDTSCKSQHFRDITVGGKSHLSLVCDHQPGEPPLNVGEGPMVVLQVGSAD